jgi:glyoxylase-like metal-dependent hydrolase (beta-lactamase superfamily II)
MTTRRCFLKNTAIFTGMMAMRSRAFGDDGIDSTLSPWQPGILDIHHINTGRGNSALMVCPDGTSVLIDAGASNSAVKYLNPARPDDSRRAGQWIGRYAKRQLRAAGTGEIDYALLTHLHPDHLGEVSAASPQSTRGDYRLTGISDVEEEISIRRIVDRGYPSYDYPEPPRDPSALNYIAFARSFAARGGHVEQVKVGHTDQIRMQRDAGRFPKFSVRMLAGNGNVWTGHGENAAPHFPIKLSTENLPSENMCSIAMKVGYGRFSYFTGGDLTDDTNYGRDLWRDIETPVSQAAGQVSVATVDHHGYFDAAGPDFVRNLQPRVWILQAWHASHPAMEVLANLYSTQLYAGPRDVFSVGLKDETALTTARFSDLLKSRDGHVLVRVEASGEKYQVIVLEDWDESDRVKAVFGPYSA